MMLLSASYWFALAADNYPYTEAHIGTCFGTLAGGEIVCPAGLTEPDKAACDVMAEAMTSANNETSMAQDLLALVRASTKDPYADFDYYFLDKDTAYAYASNDETPPGCSLWGHGGVHWNSHPEAASQSAPRAWTAQAKVCCVGPCPTSVDHACSPSAPSDANSDSPSLSGADSGLHLSSANAKILFGTNGECRLELTPTGLTSNCDIVKEDGTSAISTPGS